MKRFLLILFLKFIFILKILFCDSNYFIFIGHSTILINLDGVSILTDPNWNDRDLLLKRDTPPAIELNELPDIDIILISHAHFDHLDLYTLKKIKEIDNNFIVILPKNLGFLMEELEITNFYEMDADEEFKFKNIKIKSFRARHNGSRYIWSKIDTGLALSYLIKGSSSIFFSGDTGYTNTFKNIGIIEKIKVAFLEIQGWQVSTLNNNNNIIKNRNFSGFDVDIERNSVYVSRHLHPVQAVQAFIDLNAELFVPLHYDAFFVEFRRKRENNDPIEILKENLKKINRENSLITLKGKKIFF